VSESRQPRSIIRVNDQEFPCVTDWDVENNRFFDADTFRVEFAVSGFPQGRGPAWWLDTDDLFVEVLAGFPSDPNNFTAGELVSLIYGRVDDLDWNLGDPTMIVSGRDLTSQMIDTKTSEKYPNKKASDIAGVIAAKYGLTPKIAATSERVGTYYDQDHVRLQSEQTEWDLLTWLAREEGFQVYVSGRNLYFGPVGEVAEPMKLVYTPPTDFAPAQIDQEQVSFSQVKTLAKDISVTVKSWNPKKKRVFKDTARGAGGHGQAQEYVRNIPGLDQQQVRDRAKQILAELTQHEMNLNFSGPATHNLVIGQKIELTGTGTRADQSYYPDTIRRIMSGSYGEGYDWTVAAKNHSPENETSL